MYHLAKSLYLLATSKEEYSVILLGLDNAGKTTFHEQVKALFLPEHAHAHAPARKPIKTVPTVGQNVSTIDLPDMYLKIWDVGGQLSLRRLWQSYYASCHAIVFILDSTDIGDGVLPQTEEGEEEDGGDKTDGADADRIGDNDGDAAATAAAAAAAKKATSGVGVGAGAVVGTGGRLEECRAVLEDVLQHSDAEGVPLLILANKQDREDCVEVVRIKEGLVKRVFEGERAGAGIRDSRVLPVSALTGTGVREAVDWVRSRVKWNKEARPPVMR